MMKLLKQIALIIFTYSAFNCSSSNKNSIVNQTSGVDAALMTENVQVTNRSDSGDVEKIFAGKPISFYLSHSQIPQVCKNLYNKKIPISDDHEILALMDSIFTKNNETRPFYFLTLTQTMENADGSYAEPLGSMAKSFVETRTKEFIDYFLNEPILTDKDFDEWAKTVTEEIQIVAENHENKEADKVKKSMIENCSNCNESEKQKLNNFTLRVKHYCP